MNPTARLILLTLLYVGLLSSILNVTLLIVVLRRMARYHSEKMQQSVDITLDQLKINQIVATAIAEEVNKQVTATAEKMQADANDIHDKIDTLVQQQSRG